MVTRQTLFPTLFTQPDRARRRRGSSVLGLALFALVGTRAIIAAPPPPSSGSTPPPAVLESVQTATASELVTTMRQALASTARTGVAKVAEPAKLPRRARAFRTALAGSAEEVDALATALAAKDKTLDLFGTMQRVGTRFAALQVTFRYRGADDPETEDSFSTLTAAYGVFRRNYGRDLLAAKNEAESALSKPQRDAFDALKTRGIELSKQLRAIQPALKDNPAAAFETETVLRTLSELDTVRRDHRHLLDLLASAELLLGRWQGTRLYVNTVYPTDAAKLAPADAAADAYATALKEGSDAAFAAAGPNPAAVFERPAPYAEDLGVPALPESEVTAELAALRVPLPAASGDPSPGDSSDAVARAADRQVNVDDPDDDTSLDGGGEDDADAAGKASD